MDRLHADIEQRLHRLDIWVIHHLQITDQIVPVRLHEGALLVVQRRFSQYLQLLILQLERDPGTFHPLYDLYDIHYQLK